MKLNLQLTMLKDLAKALVPEPIWAKWRRRYRAPKTYRTWSAAARAAGTYDSDLLNRFRVARHLPKVEPLPLDHPLALALGDFPPAAAPAVTDLGGGMGDHMHALLRRWPNARCTVVETPGLVALLPSGGPVSFTTKMPVTCDVFFTSGTLQYLAFPYEALAQGATSASTAVVLTRNSFSRRPIIWVQAHRLYDNGSGPVPAGFEDCAISYPHQTLSEARVLDIASRAGFHVAHELPDSGAALPYLGRAYGKALILRK